MCGFLSSYLPTYKMFVHMAVSQRCWDQGVSWDMAAPGQKRHGTTGGLLLISHTAHDWDELQESWKWMRVWDGSACQAAPRPLCEGCARLSTARFDAGASTAAAASAPAAARILSPLTRNVKSAKEQLARQYLVGKGHRGLKPMD